MEKRIEIFEGLTPESVSQVSDNLINLVNDGEVPALKMQCMLSATEAVIKGVKSGIADAVLSEAEAEGGKTFAKYGCKVTIKEVGTKYDYSECQEWCDIQKQIDILTDKRKELEKILAPYAMAMRPYIDPTTGAECHIFKTSTTSVAVTLPK